MVRFYTHVSTTALAGLATAVMLSSCGGSTLSASSTCQDFMGASEAEQQEVVDTLATKYDKPEYTTPLGAPEVPFYCTANPSVTLGQFFKDAEE